MNLYQYCGNNPVNWTDPWGLYEEDGVLGVGSGGGAHVKNSAHDLGHGIEGPAYDTIHNSKRKGLREGRIHDLKGNLKSTCGGIEKSPHETAGVLLSVNR